MDPQSSGDERSCSNGEDPAGAQFVIGKTTIGPRAKVLRCPAGVLELLGIGQRTGRCLGQRKPTLAADLGSRKHPLDLSKGGMSPCDIAGVLQTIHKAWPQLQGPREFTPR
jgi:hypothetical protein